MKRERFVHVRRMGVGRGGGNVGDCRDVLVPKRGTTRGLIVGRERRPSGQAIVNGRNAGEDVFECQGEGDRGFLNAASFCGRQIK